MNLPQNQTESEEIVISISQEDHSKFRRLDHFFKESIPDFSRNFIQNLFKQDLISGELNDTEVKIELKKMPPANTIITIQIPPPIPIEAQPENIPIEILYEDEFLLFLNKPAGIVVHPAPGHYTGTLVNALLFHVNDLKGIGNKIRPGIVHRLDMGTSGVMVVAKEHKCHEKLVMTFANHDLERKYVAIAMGKPNLISGKLESFIGRHPNNRQKMAVTSKGKKAITHFKVLESFPKCSLIECKLETGRTHQIRVHLSSLLKTPILNDSTYGNPQEHKKRLPANVSEIFADYPYPFLHAKYLSLKHPMTGKVLEFETPPPEIFSLTLDKLRES